MASGPLANCGSTTQRGLPVVKAHFVQCSTISKTRSSLIHISVLATCCLVLYLSGFCLHTFNIPSDFFVCNYLWCIETHWVVSNLVKNTELLCVQGHYFGIKHRCGWLWTCPCTVLATESHWLTANAALDVGHCKYQMCR